MLTVAILVTNKISLLQSAACQQSCIVLAKHEKLLL